MREAEIESLVSLVAEVYAFYKTDFSKFAAGVWVQSMKPFDLSAVQQAMNRHCMNPDSGQYCPKPADIVRMLGGTSQDSALSAWSKVERTLTHKGTWVSVVFDDALIHRVLSDMGGWIPLGSKKTDELPFVRNEFVTRYRGYRMRSENPEYPRVLIGSAEAGNAQNNKPIAPPVLVGNPIDAERVMLNGNASPELGFTQITPQRLLSSLNTIETR